MYFVYNIYGILHDMNVIFAFLVASVARDVIKYEISRKMATCVCCKRNKGFLLALLHSSSAKLYVSFVCFLRTDDVIAVGVYFWNNIREMQFELLDFSFFELLEVHA